MSTALFVLLALLATALVPLLVHRRVLCPASSLLGIAVGAAWVPVVIAWT